MVERRVMLARQEVSWRVVGKRLVPGNVLLDVEVVDGRRRWTRTLTVEGLVQVLRVTNYGGEDERDRHSEP